MIWLWMLIRVIILALLIYGIRSGKLANTYFWLMWITGERDKDNNPYTKKDREFITYKLRRQVQRLGVWWWTLSLGTIVILTWILKDLTTKLYWHHFGWYDLIVVLLGVALWLIVHVMLPAEFPPEKRR